MSSDNRRQFSRILFDARATLLLGDERIPVHLVDISLRGALAQPKEAREFPLGGTGVLEVFLDGGGMSIRMDVSLAHYEGGHLGMVCREIDLDSMIHLRRLVELNLGDESILHRELGALTKLS